MQGVIAAGHPLTAEAGAEILRRGGNAVDAAVAAAFASFVAEAALVNIGGGGIAQVFDPTTGQAVAYDFFSTMPGLSPNGHRSGAALDFREVLIDFGAAQQPFYIGRGSVAVPGVVAGLGAMLAAQGSLPLATVLEPAIELARAGVVLTAEQAYFVRLLEPILTDTPPVAAIYAPSGRIATTGDRLYFPDLAKTLTRLGAEGPALFYTGAVAHQILQDQYAHGGLLTELDLARYRPLRQPPLEVPYRDFTILLPPPASIGGPLLAFALTLLAGQPLASRPHNGVEHVRTLAEVMRLTNLARAAWERGDAPPAESRAATQPPVEQLLSPARLEPYRQALAAALAGGPRQPELNLPKGPANTTHISVADRTGLVASVTTSAGESAGFVVGDTGLTLNNMLGEIDLHPHGFHRLPPGQRLSTMMSPAVVLHHGQPVLVVGSGGSNRLRSAILQTISNVIDFGLPLDQAVAAPRIHFEENVLQLEGGLAPAVADALEAGGYTVNRWPERNMFFGGAHAVARRAGAWVAAGDLRRGGAVAIT